MAIGSEYENNHRCVVYLIDKSMLLSDMTTPLVGAITS